MGRRAWIPVAMLAGVVACGGGGSSSGSGGSTPPASAPSITGMSPTSGPVGTSVILTGSAFSAATGVAFHGTAATVFTVNSATSITAAVPAGATTGPVSVTTPAGTGVSSGAFTVTPAAPALTSFAPASGPAGTSVLLTGSNLTGATAVAFHGTAASAFTVDSPTQITATVPAGATTGTISVTTPGGLATSASPFTVTGVVAAPSITSFSPASGAVGASVVITGTALTGATAVAFHGTAASAFTVNASTQITATVPSGATTGTISVTTAGGTAVSASSFTVTGGAGGGATLYPTGQILPAGASGARTLKVRNQPGAWTAASNDAWLHVTAGATGSGDSAVSYQADVNAGAAPRTGTLTVAGQTFTVWQDGAQTLVHPRLWMNPGDAARLQGWATASNPIFQNGFNAALSQATAYANAHWNWSTGKPDTVFVSPYQPDQGVVSGWKDDGGSNWQGDCTEAYAECFAFASQLQTTQAQRDYYGTRARAMLMWVITNAATAGGSHGLFPFGGATVATFNRANYWGEAFGLTVDWAYPYFSAADKQKIQTVFRMWAVDELNAATAGNEHPQPIGAENSTTLLADAAQLRWAANNYFIGHTRELALMSLCLDPADDPSQGGQYPTMGSYRGNVTGAWLYQIFAMFADKPAVVAGLGAPSSNPSLGLASGGLPVEGSLYGESQGYLFQALLALHTAGYDDPTISGPQVGLTTSSYWDRSIQGFLLTLAPQSKVLPGASYLGQVYPMAAYGDILNSWIGYENIEQWGPVGIFKMREGDPTGWDACRWIATNALEGGAADLTKRASQVWGNSNASYAIYYLMLMDPNAAAPADPRPAQPLVFQQSTFGRVLARSDWSPSATLFTYLGGWQSINHQQGAANQIELYRKGEWLTKEWDGYGNDFKCYTPTYHNTLSIQNDVPTDLQWYEGPTSTLGGQWFEGSSAGDPVVLTGSGAGWVYAQGDTTKCYNKPGGGAVDVQHASRSTVWLSPDHLVVYDRAATGKTGRFKRWNLVLLSAPVIAQDAATHTWKATVTTPSGQQFFVQHLLPAGATMVEQHDWTTNPSQEFSLVSNAEDAAYRLKVEDPSNPTSIRFLHVLQGADAGAAQTATQALKDATGTTFDIAVVGKTAVLFPITLGSTGASLTWTVPATVQGNLVTGLAPGAGFDLVSSSGPGGLTFTLSSGTTYHADASGVLALGTIAP